MSKQWSMQQRHLRTFHALEHVLTLICWALSPFFSSAASTSFMPIVYLFGATHTAKTAPLATTKAHKRTGWGHNIASNGLQVCRDSISSTKYYQNALTCQKWFLCLMLFSKGVYMHALEVFRGCGFDPGVAAVQIL